MLGSVRRDRNGAKVGKWVTKKIHLLSITANYLRRHRLILWAMDISGMCRPQAMKKAVVGLIMDRLMIPNWRIMKI